MQGTTVEKTAQIKDDVQTSWYFRIWLVLWLVCAIFGFIAFIVLSARSGSTHPTFHVWVENATELFFPRFHFEVGYGEEQIIQSVECTHNTMHLTTTTCSFEEAQRIVPANKCKALNTDGVKATNKMGESYLDAQIDCLVITEGFANGDNTVLRWGVEDPTIPAELLRHLTLEINSTEGAWIRLNKEIFSTKDGQFNDWRRSLVYHSSVANQGRYRVSIVLNDFLVRHYEDYKGYNGWMSTGATGGFAFFLVILHTMVMGLVGICFDNDSKFLGAKE